jgi:hypothetical protein
MFLYARNRFLESNLLGATLSDIISLLQTLKRSELHKFYHLYLT